MRIPSSAMNVTDRIIRKYPDFYLKCNKFTRQTTEQSDKRCDALRTMTKKYNGNARTGGLARNCAVSPFRRYFSSPPPLKADHSRIQETRYHVSPHQRNLEYFQFPTVHNNERVYAILVDESRGPQPPIKDNHAESHTDSGEIGRRMHTTPRRKRKVASTILYHWIETLVQLQKSEFNSYCTYCYPSISFL